MKALIYDTETTGLPDWNKPSEDECQPRVTQLAAELFDDDTGETIATVHAIIKPDGWTIPEELEKLTGITNEKAENYGVSMKLVLPVFFEMWQLAGHRIAHNESFDMRMIRIELIRNLEHFDPEHPDDWKKGKAYCTMANSTSILKLPPTERMRASGRNGPKPPNLGEAYKHFTGQDLVGAHNAAVDLMACKAVYFGIRKAA